MSLIDAFLGGYNVVQQNKQFKSDQARTERQFNKDIEERKRHSVQGDNMDRFSLSEMMRRQLSGQTHQTGERIGNQTWQTTEKGLDRGHEKSLREYMEGMLNSRQTQSLGYQEGWNLRDANTRLAMNKLDNFTQDAMNSRNNLTNRYATDKSAFTIERGQDKSASTTERGQDINQEIAMTGLANDMTRHNDGLVYGKTPTAYEMTRGSDMRNEVNRQNQALNAILQDGNPEEIQAAFKALSNSLSGTDPRMRQEYDLDPFSAQLGSLITDESRDYSKQDIGLLNQIRQSMEAFRGVDPDYFNSNRFIKNYSPLMNQLKR